MPFRNLLYKKSLFINDKISVVVPTVGDVLKNEAEYYKAATILTATPYDMMVQLDDIGVDFTEIRPFDVLLLFWGQLKSSDTSLLLGGLDLSKFMVAVDKDNRAFLVDEENDIIIDEAVYEKIADAVRSINMFKKEDKRPANKEAKSFMIERARVKQRRAAKKEWRSALENYVVALVNTEQFKYNFEQCLSLSIYQFNASLNQIIKKVDYEHVMAGFYAGTVDAKKLNQDDLIWFQFIK